MEVENIKFNFYVIRRSSMKYIIFTDGSAVIFGDTTSHKAVAGNRPVSSAGFCRVETFRNDYDDVRAKVSAWGKSDSLDAYSHPGDNMVLEMMFMQ